MLKKLLIGAALVGIAYVLVLSIPDAMRYAKIKSM
jgi:hypothetical protein